MTRLLFSPIVTLSLRPGRGPNGGLISKHRIALLGPISQSAKWRAKSAGLAAPATAGRARYGRSRIH